MALDTSLLSESASLLKGTQRIQAEQANADADAASRGEEAKQQNIQKTGQMIQQGVTNAYNQKQADKRTMITIDDPVINGYTALKGEDSKFVKFLQGMKGKQVRDTVFMGWNANDNQHDLLNQKQEFATQMQEIKNQSNQALLDAKLKHIEDMQRYKAFKLGDKYFSPAGFDEESGAMRLQETAYNPDAKKGDKEKKSNEKDLLSKRDAAAKSIRDFIAKNGTGEDSSFQLPSTGRKNEALRTMLSEQAKNYSKYQDQLSKMGSAEQPDADILEFSKKIMSQGRSGGPSSSAPGAGMTHIRASDGSVHWVKDLAKAKTIDPKLEVIQ